MKKCFRTGGLFLASMALLPFAAQAEASSLPALEPGASLFWNSVYEGSPSNFRERVVAAGEDWVLYETRFEDDWGDDTSLTENLFLLFSGIDYRSCLDGPLPSDAERAALRALRPFKEGDTVELTTVDGSPTVKVGEAVAFFLMGGMRPARRIFIDHEDDTSDENLVVLDEVDVTVAIDWGDKSRDKLMAITSGKADAPTFSQEELGICAPLLFEDDN